jgi:hypothetical protein
MIKLTENIHLFDREDWGAADARPTSHQDRDIIHEAFLHHGAEANASSINHLSEQYQMMRDIQALHMDRSDPKHGWSDIGYHFVVFQAYGDIPFARIFRGRDVESVPAAQQGHNTGTVAICVVGDFRSGHDQLKDNTRFAIEVLLKWMQNHDDPKWDLPLRTLGGHRQVTQTECPGGNIMQAIPTIARAAGLRVF